MDSFLNRPVINTLLIQLLIAYEWIKGGGGKFMNEKFISGMGKTLSKFAEGNPHAWYVKNVLVGAQGSAELFGQLVVWGELLAGVGLATGAVAYLTTNHPTFKRVVAVVALVSALVGMWLNANFYFAAGWTSASTKGLNVVMFWTQGVLVFAWIMALIHLKRSAATKKE